jgi:hypothetical protein
MSEVRGAAVVGAWDGVAVFGVGGGVAEAVAMPGL